MGSWYIHGLSLGPKVVRCRSHVLIQPKYRDHRIGHLGARSAKKVKTMTHEYDECDVETLKKMGSWGLAWRISTSIVSFFGWLAFFILWLAFYASDYNVYENLAIIILSIVAFVVLNVTVWVPFGLRFAGEEHRHKARGSDIASMLAGVAWLAFLVIWLLQYAGDYSIYQNFAVFIVSALVFGGISAASHAVGWARHPGRN